MAKYNNDIKSGLTTNHNGAPAYKMNPDLELVTLVLTTFMNDSGKYYDAKSNNTIVDAIRAGIIRNPEFVAKLGIYARTVSNLRSISHVIFAELAHAVKGKEYTKNAIRKGIVRVDDMTEIMAYYIKTYGKPVPNSLKKGLASACTSFTKYQFAKYNRDGYVTLQDLFNMCHPKPLNSANKDAFEAVINGTLPTPETWETYLSAHGNNAKSWEHLIDNNSIGYMAMLRNLRNIAQAEVSDAHIDKVVEYITNRTNVLNSKQLPFRFLSAYRELKKVIQTDYTNKIKFYVVVTTMQKFLKAIEVALEISIENVPMIPGRTMIAVDVSGSMNNKISQNSDVTAREIANLMAAICAKVCEKAIIIHFDTTAKLFTFNNNESVLSQIEKMPSYGGGTDLTVAIDALYGQQIVVDRVIYLSDNEINQGFEHGNWTNRVPLQTCWSAYKQKFNPEAWIHAIDILGYGTQQVKGKNTNILGGWNERVLDFISLTEKGLASILDAINQIEI